MEYKIIVVGIGPGSPDYLPPVAKRTIDSAKVVVGSRRALAAFAPPMARTWIIDKDVEGTIAYIRTELDRCDVVVMVSGDPGFYSLLAVLRQVFGAERLTVIPGISSVQLAFAKIADIWQDAILTSLHGRQAPAETLRYTPGKKLGILTDAEHSPAYIASLLTDLGWPATATVHLCANLSYEDEKIVRLSLAEAKLITGFTHCVMVVAA